MRLAEFGEKYPFLKPNLMFWERHIKARGEMFNLLGHAVNLSRLKEASFPAGSAEPLLDSLKLSLADKDITALIETFCHSLGIEPRPFTFPNPIPRFEELNLTADTEGFVLAEVHSAIASFIESVVADDQEAIHWMEPFCPICGAHAGFGIITPSGKKNLVCSHCYSVWDYMRTACGLCGHTEERGTAFLSTEELPDWTVETCEVCGHYLKVCDMRNTLPDIITYPLHYLTTWELDLAVREKGYEPAFFQVFERAGWIRL